MSSILARSIPCCTTGGGSNLFECGIPATPYCTIIMPGDTAVVDTLPTLYYKGSKWLINVADIPFTRVSSYEVYSINKQGIAASHVTYAILGQTIVHFTDVVINSANMELQVTNNDTVPITVCITRLPIPTSLGVTFIQSGPVNAYTPIVGLYGSISPTDTLTIDTVTYPRVKSVKWLVSIILPSTNEKRSFEIYSTFRDSAFVTYTSYGFLADLINITPNVIQIGNVVTLQITNNETMDVIVDVTRIPIAMDLSTVCQAKPEGDILIITPINDVTILPSATVTVDAPTFMDHQSVKWLVSVTDPTTNKVMGVQVYTTHRSGTLPINTNYTIIGDFINVDVSVAIMGLTLTLQITNNSLNTVVIDTIRIPVSV